MNIEQLKRFVALTEEKKALDEKKKQIDAELDEVEVSIVKDFEAEGVQKMSIDGRTVYLAEDLYCSPLEGDREAVIKALRSAGMRSMVKPNYNTQTLTAYVREIGKSAREACEAAGELFDEEKLRAALPRQLAKTLKVSFVHVLRSRKA